MQFKVYIALLAAIKAVSAVPITVRSFSNNTITSNTISTGISPDLKQVTISPNVYWSIWNTEAHITEIDVNTGGALYVSAPAGSSYFAENVVGDFSNDGVVSFNGANSTRSIINFQATNFNNTGQLFFVGGSDRDTTSVSLGPSSSNTGFITFYGSSDEKVNLVIDSDSFSNKGDICLKNQNLEINMVIDDQGCIHIGDGSKLTIPKDSKYNNIQNYYMEGKDAEIVFTFGTPYVLSAQRFSEGNKISADLELDNFSYNQDGHMTVYSGTQSFVLYIGTDYEVESFSIESGSLIYNKPVPFISSQMPTVCHPCPAIPQANY